MQRDVRDMPRAADGFMGACLMTSLQPRFLQCSVNRIISSTVGYRRWERLIHTVCRRRDPVTNQSRLRFEKL